MAINTLTLAQMAEDAYKADHKGLGVGSPLNSIKVRICKPKDVHSITPLVETLSQR